MVRVGVIQSAGGYDRVKIKLTSSWKQNADSVYNWAADLVRTTLLELEVEINQSQCLILALVIGCFFLLMLLTFTGSYGTDWVVNWIWRSGNVLILTTLIPLIIWLCLWTLIFYFHKHSYISDSDYDANTCIPALKSLVSHAGLKLWSSMNRSINSQLSHFFILR